MNYENDKRIVMTLDAGGTNFVFSAMQSNCQIIAPVCLPSYADNLERCLKAIVEGFNHVKSKLPALPSAISFAFPGPADYENGIIGDLGNLPSFRGGVALGPMLEEIFGIPVFINNDGDLFVYGEAIGGFLANINTKLRSAGSKKQYKNLFGITLGTGFGGGIVRNDELFTGDNGAAAEIWLMRNKLHSNTFAEEGASIRAIQRVYNENCADKNLIELSPKEIFEIATGVKPGNRTSAIKAFDALGEVVGDALANAITLVDGLIVIGGGLSGAASLFLPRIVDELNGTIESLKGEKLRRLEMKSYNLEDEKEFNEFISGTPVIIDVPYSKKKVTYDPVKRIGVGISKLETSTAVAIGAYNFALHILDTKMH